jgi:predicted nucleic acid-binding protein
VSALVADASVVAKCILPESGSDHARVLIHDAESAVAPANIHAECANAVWKLVHRGLMTRESAALALLDLETIPISLQSLRRLTPAAFALALEYDHPIYDCYYLAAAIQHDAALATADVRLFDLAQRAGLGERAILVR